MRAARIAIAALALVCAERARADEVEDFYRGKTIQFIIRSAAGGGGYDSYARLLGRHIGRHIPGNPNVIPVNMPGGGGIVSANYVAKVAPKDGTILAITPQYVTQKLITPILQVGLRKDPALPDTPLLRDMARAPAAPLALSQWGGQPQRLPT